ncbi:unnamed protein product [Mytilus coruscus]|uniref:G-protein coupled receptors family 1 profile domain-containing protein n=1 Tax=Mytilus coruscus TaxID=42192 RepID=A0A6J8DCQ5_MYTCO|nr:unnamed protein product [Mytilus coruscus]
MLISINESKIEENGTDTNVTDLSRKEYSWNIYLETFILSAVFGVGIVANIFVMKTTFQVKTKFARQIMSLFFSLALTDITVCLIRIGILIYILFHPDWDDGSLVCFLWYMSLAIVGTAIWEKLFVGVQRLFILKAFPMFRKYCTIPLMVVLIVGICLSQCIIHVGTFIGFDINVRYENSQRICMNQNRILLESLCYRIVGLGVSTIVPLVLAISCHFWIVHIIFKAGQTKLSQFDDREDFIKITKTALIRSFALFVCFMPFLVVNVIDPYHDVVSGSILRYSDYLLCAHSAISPLVTLQDCDFGDDMSNRKSTKHRRNSMSPFNNSFRRIGVSVITSENLKTNKNND